jgi:hypothetical protein
MSTYNYGSKWPLAHVTYAFLDAIEKGLTPEEKKAFRAALAAETGGTK